MNEGAPTQKESFEIMKTPEIVVQGEKGVQLFSLILKAEDPSKGETETPLAKETSEYFKDNPLDPEILKTIKEIREQGVDKESAYNAALTYQHPERIDGLFEMVAKHKPNVKNPQEMQQKILTLLDAFDKSFSSSPLAKKFADEEERDKNKRLGKIEETKEWVEDIIAFFKPDSETTKIQKLSFIPTDPLSKVDSGKAFRIFPGEQIIMSHVDNVENQKHEFLHGIINPIVDKLSLKLTEEEKENISRLARERLKHDYGENYYSLLCEEFIRTYLQTYKQDHLLRTRDIEENKLRVLIFEFYKEYESRTDRNENFEQFVLDKFAGKMLSV